MRTAVLALLASLVVAPARPQTIDSAAERIGAEARVESHAPRYGLADTFKKLTDNHGNGFEPLYGTRNFRVVLDGVVYRGGANNAFHRGQQRDNRNPLPNDGLENLCAEGFGRAYYLYTTNYDKAPGVTRCRTAGGASHSLAYLQASPFDERGSHDILKAVFESIMNDQRGPIYLQCWNGWHASGLMAAKVLRQFCGFSPDEAVRYWDMNTDGHDTEPRFEQIRQRIRDFVPYADLAITSDKAAAVCPSPLRASLEDRHVFAAPGDR